MKKSILHIAIAISLALSACTGSGNKNANTEASATDSASVSPEEKIELPADSDFDEKAETQTILRQLYRIYYSPFLMNEKGAYSDNLNGIIKSYGFTGDSTEPTDVMTADFRRVWEDFNKVEDKIEFLDWDVFREGQDIFNLEVVYLSADFDGNDKASINMNVSNSGTIYPKTFKFLKTDGEWRLDDITYKSETGEMIKEPMRRFTAKNK